MPGPRQRRVAVSCRKAHVGAPDTSEFHSSYTSALHREDLCALPSSVDLPREFSLAQAHRHGTPTHLGLAKITYPGFLHSSRTAAPRQGTKAPQQKCHHEKSSDEVPCPMLESRTFSSGSSRCG